MRDEIISLIRGSTSTQFTSLLTVGLHEVDKLSSGAEIFPPPDRTIWKYFQIISDRQPLTVSNTTFIFVFAFSVGSSTFFTSLRYKLIK